MKKTLLIAGSVLALGISSFGQGYINWGTATPTYLTFQTNSANYSSLDASLGGGAAAGGTVGSTAAATSGALFYYQLLYVASSGVAGPTTLAQLNTWNGLAGNGGTILSGTNASTAGRVVLLGATGALGTSGAQVAWANGTSYSIAIAGWSSNLGNNFATVLNLLNNWQTLGSGVTGQAFFGVTSSGTGFNPNNASPGATPFGTGGLLINSPNTQLNLLQAPGPVPEPGTMALAALGGASLLLFRRRK